MVLFPALHLAPCHRNHKTSSYSSFNCWLWQSCAKLADLDKKYETTRLLLCLGIKGTKLPFILHTKQEYFIKSTAFDPQKNVFNEYLKMEAIELSLLLVDNLFLLNSFDTFLVYSSEVLFSCLSLVLMMTVLVENSLTAKEV